MSILSIILTIIGMLIAFLLITALFTKPEFAIEQEVTINKPKQQVFDYIRYMKNQEQYSKWVMADPGKQTKLTGTDGTVGAIYAWDSQDKGVGKGEQEIRQITEGEKVSVEIRFEKPFKATSFADMTTTAPDSDHTKVKWVFSGTNNYVMRIFNVAFNLKKKLGSDMLESLNNLKTQLEK